MYNCDDYNPCTAENINDGKRRWPADERDQFVQCDRLGGCSIVSCEPETQWDQEKQRCDYVEDVEADGSDRDYRGNGNSTCST